MSIQRAGTLDGFIVDRRQRRAHLSLLSLLPLLLLHLRLLLHPLLRRRRLLRIGRRWIPIKSFWNSATFTLNVRSGAAVVSVVVVVAAAVHLAAS